MVDIFKILNDATTGSPGPRELYAVAELDPIMRRVKELTSATFAERLEELNDNILEEETDEHFARGFRIGAQIMLAVLTDGQTASR